VAYRPDVAIAKYKTTATISGFLAINMAEARDGEKATDLEDPRMEENPREFI